MLIGLLVIDFLFIGIFVFYGIQQVISENPAKFPQMWSLSADYSIPEFFGYAKLALIALFLFVVYQKTSQRIWWSWSIVFALLLADDMLLLHEYGGEWVANFIPLASIGGIETHHIGELVVYAVLAMAALVILFIGLLDTPAKIEARSGFFLVVVFGLVACGVGVDLLTSTSYFHHTDGGDAVAKTLYGALLIAEDGGVHFHDTRLCRCLCKLAEIQNVERLAKVLLASQALQHTHNFHDDWYGNNQNADGKQKQRQRKQHFKR